MEFKIKRQNFLEGLTKTQSVVERKNTMPVLSNVLLKAEKTGLKITATDLEVALVYQAEALVSKPGQITIPCKSLHDIVREINHEDIKVTLIENDRIRITAGSSQFTIPGLAAEEFPPLPEVNAKSMEIPSEKIISMIEKTIFSMSTDETRHNLAGILFQKRADNVLRFVATDGHRLSLKDEQLEISDWSGQKIILPRKGINELKKLVSTEGTFELAIGEKNIFARKGNETLYVRLIDGEFPDYDRVIPKDNDKTAKISRDEFIGALRRVSLLSNERSRGVVLSFSPGLLEVSINNPDLGEAREEFQIDYSGEKLSIGFNAKYLLDVLDVIKKDEKISIDIKTDLAPCLIKSPSDEGFICVVMPMRI